VKPDRVAIRAQQIETMKDRIAKLKSMPTIQAELAIGSATDMSPSCLNLKVLERTLEKVQDTPESKLDDTYELILEGWDVYEERYMWIPLMHTVISCYLLSSLRSFSAHFVLATLVYFWYDFFSGVLHVVVDEPLNLRGFRSLLAAKPCLEFQWHHYIPNDISRKSMLQVVGDLNIITFPLFAWYILVWRAFESPLGSALVAYKILSSYFGQVSHRCAHELPNRNPKIVLWLQWIGVMLPPEVHRGHHHHHDDNFCIGAGWFNAPIRQMRKFTHDPNFWACLFFLMMMFDFPMLLWCSTKICVYYGLL